MDRERIRSAVIEELEKLLDEGVLGDEEGMDASECSRTLKELSVEFQGTQVEHIMRDTIFVLDCIAEFVSERC